MKNRKDVLYFLFPGFLYICGACGSAPPPVSTPVEQQNIPDESFPYYGFLPDPDNLPVSSFDEIWGYLVSGREEALLADLPLSDVGYFGAEVDSYGQLTDVPDRGKIAWFPGRTHLVVTCNSRSLTHFVLEPDGRARAGLIAGLLAAVKPFDGLQIDFELVPAKDGESFRSFLVELRRGLGDKMLTIALPARTRLREDDVYNYREIAPLVDRVLVMAYDEHWSSSEPGPIASLEWCRSVAAHALGTVGPEKLIMGLPFYGRTWGNVQVFRAFFFSGIERIKEENKVRDIRREGGIPTFTYEIPTTVTVYYEDAYSLSTRLDLYRSMGVRSAGFWSLGQETPAIWSLITLSGRQTLPDRNIPDSVPLP
ncbi:MAG: glycoside hydrolase [Spirochaetaceae bacterium]|jgi:spore germination protein YaaH|nr:glycoside hydrolase [Spirochaetaceae bacterium]